VRIDRRGDIAAVLVEGDSAAVQAVCRRVAFWPGPIVTVQGAAPGQGLYSLDLLVTETSISTNTAAAGGNAGLMALV
jgi:RHH-type transcriptional regulator, proline utilization regulon repressor / proline dehydrogenase / delta 1-pyrroline-5-carboxylate dehydrogenase